MSTHYCGVCPLSGTIDDFPLVNARVHYDIIDVQSHRATLIQTYTSNASLAANVNYVFPLPSDASVCSFKAVIDGKRTIKAIVKEKTTAKAEYNEAVSQGKTAALLEQSNVEIFQVSLGNILPKSTIEIHISFASVVSHHGELDTLRLTFPTAIAPKYGAAPNSELNYISNVRGWFHPLVRSFSSALDFSVAVQMTSHIKSINSPSHPISMKMGQSSLDDSAEFDPGKARISLSSSTLLDKDIVVELTCQGLDKPRCTVESFSPEEGAYEFTDAYALTFVPRFELPPLPSQEFIFLVDRSGSMTGGKIQAVRSALQIMLRSLPTRGTTFNLLSFGSRHSSLWPMSVAYSGDSLKAASRHVDGFEADHGGTETRVALETAFGSRTKDIDTPTTVFILTDGEAYDLDGVQAATALHVSRYKGNANFLRVFCMGIGNAVSKAMCDVIARAGQGTAVYVGEEEKPDQKLMGLLRAARGPPVENITVDWGVPADSSAEKEDFDFEIVSSNSGPAAAALPPISLFDESIRIGNTGLSGPDTTPVKLPPPPTVQQAPGATSLPPIYPGFRTSIFAIVKRAMAGNSAPSKVVRIFGSALGRPVTLEVAVSPIVTSKESFESSVKVLHVLAARALVQRFEDEGKAGIMTRELKAEVLRVAERYGIASSETSFVAVDESGTTVDVVQLVIADHSFASSSYPGGKDLFNLAQSYQSSFAYPQLSAGFASSPPQSGSLGSGQPALAAPMLSMARRPRRAPVSRAAVSPVQASEAAVRPMQMFSADGYSKQSDTAAQPQSLSPTIESFARSQSFEGSFDGSPALYQLLVKQSNPPTKPNIISGMSDLTDKIWCTLLCVAYLETKLAGERDVWAIMVEKAMTWVEEALESMLGLENLPAKKEALKESAKNCVA